MTSGPHSLGAPGDNLGVRTALRTVAWVGVLSLVSLAACSGGGSASGKTIRIGVDLPLSGGEGQSTNTRSSTASPSTSARATMR
jgi:hypothetical protein